jgi:hypothetical protein
VHDIYQPLLLLTRKYCICTVCVESFFSSKENANIFNGRHFKLLQWIISLYLISYTNNHFTSLLYTCYHSVIFNEALCYKPEDCGFDSRWCHWIFFNLPNPSSPGVGSASNRNEYQESSWGVKDDRSARKADLTAICEPIFLENVGTSTSHNPMGLHGLLQGYLYLFFFT